MKTPKNRRTVETIAAPEPPWSPALRHYALGLLLFVILAFEVYGPALHGEFLFDDSYLPFLVPEVAEGPLRGWLGGRPVTMISYWLNYQASALNPYPYHVVSVVLHALSAMLLWLIVRSYLTWVGEQGILREIISLFAGLLFLLHPVQTEAVAYVSSRSETVSVFFFLSALAVYAYSRHPVGWIQSGVILLLFGVACLSKEHSVVLAPLLLLSDFYFGRRNWRLYSLIGAAALAAVVFVLWMLRGASTAGFGVKEFTWYEYLFTQFRSIWLYLRLYVFPFGLNGDYDWAPSRSILDGGSLFGLIGLLALAFFAWKYRREYPLASFGFFTFLLLLAPTSSIVPIRDVAAERRLYLPFIGLLLITVDFLRRWKASPKALLGAMAVICVAAGAATYQRSSVWGSALAFWQDTVNKSPQNSRAVFQLAYAQWHNNQCSEAVTTYERVAKMKPRDYTNVLVDWALALECAGRVDDAIAKLNEAAKVTPSATIYANIGMINGKHGRAEPALEALAAAEKLDAQFDMTYVYRGNVLVSRNDLQGAATEYKKALELKPSNQLARDGLLMVQQRMAAPAR